jgi:hypothetical protein
LELDVLVKVLNCDTCPLLFQALLDVDERQFPVAFVLQPRRSDFDPIGIAPWLRNDGALLSHLEDGPLHPDAIHADGFDIRITTHVGPAEHERTVDGCIARDATTIVDNLESRRGCRNLRPKSLEGAASIGGAIPLCRLAASQYSVEAIVNQVENCVL